MVSGVFLTCVRRCSLSKNAQGLSYPLQVEFLSSYLRPNVVSHHTGKLVNEAQNISVELTK
jgi:hypothetical protein